MLKRNLQRAVAILTTLAVVIGTAAASSSMGEIIHHSSLTLSENTTLANGTFWSSHYLDKRVERYIEYVPNSSVTPIVTYGDKVTSKITLSNMAKKLEASGQHVVAGINGDYFVLSNGIPLGLVITDGILRTGSSYHWAVGFNSDGTAFTSIPKLAITAHLGNHTVAIADVNKARTGTGGIYLINSDFNHTTGNTEAGIDVIITPTSGALSIGGTITGTVDQVLESTGPINIPEGKMILTVNLKSAADKLSALRALRAGDSVSISVTAADARWNNVQYAVGALYQLVSNGTVVSGLEAGAAPRTAVGIKADGTTIFYTMDGRQSGYSIGASLTQVAERLIELGCVEAVCLDGGGSTTITATYPDSNVPTTISFPSEGTERAVSTHIFLVSSAQPTGILDHFYLSAYDSVVLAGSSVQFAPTAIDTAHHKMTNPASLSYSVTSGGGSVSSSGLFTAGTEAGTSVVTVSSGSATGTATITVVKVPSHITVSAEGGSAVTGLALAPNDVINLTAAATGQHMYLISQDTSYTWSVVGDVGTVDNSGTFTAAPKSGSGTITVSAGGESAIVNVIVKGSLNRVEDFENGLTPFNNMSAAGITATTEENQDKVKYGFSSAALAYDTTASGTASIPLSLGITRGHTQLNLWVYGDNSGNTLIMGACKENGESSNIVVTPLNFTGWKQISAALPAGTTGISSLSIIYSGGATAKGTILLDQITSANEVLTDTDAPVIAAEISGTILTATLTDAVDTVPQRSGIEVSYDGQLLVFSYDAATGKLSTDLPVADGQLHRITITARDKSGNIGRKSLNLIKTSEEPGPFIDMTGHWAAAYTDYLFGQSIVSGIPTAAGLTYQPDKSMTRAAFAMIMYNWLDSGDTDLSGVVLPFVDETQIPDWSLDAVKFMYFTGIIKGSNNNGVISFNPNGSITRAEAMTMIGRTQERGYSEAALNFDDTATIPVWSLSYVKSLVCQDIISGYNNMISPNNTITRGAVAKILFSLM